MPKNCVVFGCSNHSWKNDKKRSYFEFPKRLRSPERRDKWLARIDRKNEDGSRWSPPQSRVVCSDHFITGKPVKDPLHPDHAPSLELHTSNPQQVMKSMERYRRHTKINLRQTVEQSFEGRRTRPACVNRLPFSDVTNRPPDIHEELEISTGSWTDENLQDNTDVNNINPGTSIQDPADTDSAIQEAELRNLSLRKQLHDVKEEMVALKKKMKTTLSADMIRNDDAKAKFFTGLSWEIFEKTFEYLVQFIQQRTTKDSLSNLDQYFVTLVRLRQNLSFKMLGFQTGCGETTIVDYFWKWTDVMYWKLKHLVCWPDRESMIATLPDEFHQIYPRLTAIIDCFEIFIGNPGPLKARQQTYSNYKHHTTAKVLIACNPLGAITFLSLAWGGRVSDVEIVRKSGFISPDLHMPGDQVLADRGFTLQDDFATMCSAELLLPAFTKGKSQLSPREVECGRKLSSVRIHVERVIGLLKNRYTIVQGTLPTKMVKSLKDEVDNVEIASIDRLIHVCAALVNLGDSIVFKG